MRQDPQAEVLIPTAIREKLDELLETSPKTILWVSGGITWPDPFEEVIMAQMYGVSDEVEEQIPRIEDKQKDRLSGEIQSDTTLYWSDVSGNPFIIVGTSFLSIAYAFLEEGYDFDLGIIDPVVIRTKNYLDRSSKVEQVLDQVKVHSREDYYAGLSFTEIAAAFIPCVVVCSWVPPIERFVESFCLDAGVSDFLYRQKDLRPSVAAERFLSYLG